MIQELLGDAAAASGLIIGSSGTGERKITIDETFTLHPSPYSPYPPNSCPTSFPSPITTTATATMTKNTSSLTAATTTKNSEAQNLKCPRCNSTNTKFCYYNNYNLTQPRHFCKGCRRYWTKGGALRNVPIGGGCRKNKITSCLSSTAGKSSAAKVRMNLPLCQGMLGNGYDQDQASGQMFWPSPQDSHILALLRAARDPDPVPNLPGGFTIKREGLVMESEDLGMMSPSSVGPGGFLSYNNELHSHVGRSRSFMKNSHDQDHHGLVHKEAQSSKVQLIRSMSLAGCGLADHPPASVLSGNFVSNLSSSGALSAIFESTPVLTRGGGDLINPSMSWASLPTVHGGHH